MSVSVASNKRKTMIIWSGILLLAILVLPMLGYVVSDYANAENGVKQTNPRADTWRQVRDNVTGYSAVKGRETNELIQSSGEDWRQLRNGPLTFYGSVLLTAVVIALIVFYVTRGQVKLTRPRRGETVERWTLNERRLHWVTALLFILLTISGLSLFYGRQVLIPLLGHGGFSAYAIIAKWLHNVIGPLFMLSLLIMLTKWLKHNFFNRADIAWFKALGGMVGANHPSAARMNGGEKLWFWLLAIVGIVLCLSGLVLDFPNFNQQREIIQLAHVLHLTSALLLIAFSLGHIYIGTMGIEGALEGMTSGQVDVAWAEQHHDLWLAELQKKQQLSKK